MNALYEFPQKAVYGKVLPKTKIYAYASPAGRVKDLFTRQVERIIWSHKLSPKTINLSAAGYIHEIQIMTIDLKIESLSHDILAVIDKVIPSPILFELRYKNKIRYAAAFKRPSEADKTKRVVSGYFESDWLKDDVAKQPLPVVLNLKGLYHHFLRTLVPASSGSNESIDELVARAEQIQMMQRETLKLETRMNREKQYNRKVELHSQLGNLKKEIAALSRK